MELLLLLLLLLLAASCIPESMGFSYVSRIREMGRAILQTIRLEEEEEKRSNGEQQLQLAGRERGEREKGGLWRAQGEKRRKKKKRGGEERRTGVLSNADDESWGGGWSWQCEGENKNQLAVQPGSVAASDATTTTPPLQPGGPRRDPI
ncbi:unnamed protein product [Pleuronectes platessa]|uniref:Uncharacterized protein n=1 Tax=Pleuronectes platessa TaxID=8262 RepID=A0A9N7YBT5_PLEPL|nr:unnamed protein product [Pleuronectes platessa]